MDPLGAILDLSLVLGDVFDQRWVEVVLLVERGHCAAPIAEFGPVLTHVVVERNWVDVIRISALSTCRVRLVGRRRHRIRVVAMPALG